MSNRDINPYESPPNVPRQYVYQEEFKKYGSLEILFEMGIPGYALYNGIRWDRAIASQKELKFSEIHTQGQVNEYIKIEAIKLGLIGLVSLVSITFYNLLS